MPILEIDYKVREEDLDLNLYSKINGLSPFGVRNMRPVLLLKKVEPYYIETVGKDNKHLKFTLKHGEGSIRVIAFNMGEYAEKIKEEPTVDIVFHLDKNLWNNREYLQIQVLDISLNEK
jgi:single-stranded-DNA-specific exonuclease